MREELVPEDVGKVAGDDSKDGKEVCFEGADCSFSNVAAVDIQRDKLEGAVPVFNYSTAGFGTGFVVEDLEVNAVAFGLEASRDVVVGGKTMAIFARLKYKDKDGVGVNVVDEHDVSVSTLRVDG